MSSEPLFRIPPGTSAAEHLSPAYPERAARGTADKLRAWQADALEHYFSRDHRDFLVAATPGSGKTTFALRLATELLARRTIDRVSVVTPTDHLKHQWADAAARVGLRLDPGFRNRDGSHSRDFHGIAVTYAQVAVRSRLHRTISESGRTLVILDEVHHGGDALSWGDGIRDAFESATRRISLTGTPFRSDTSPIPFVSYHPQDDGSLTSRADYSYGYGRALADGVVRPVIFLAYAGRMRWRTRAGEEMEARLGEGDTRDVTAQAWRTALDAQGEWIPSVLTAANQRLSEVRASVPDAAGLVIATDQDAARAYAAILARITGVAPTLVLSDEKASSNRIGRFAKGSSRWMVAVRMVSEGVDIPRLSVGVYATSASTPLYFAQAVGRFVRTRRRGETASIFLPSVPSLLALAGQLELERDHALDRFPRPESDLLDPESRNEAELSDRERGEGSGFAFLPIESDANFDRVLFEGDEFGFAAGVGTPEEEDFIGLPGLLEPDQVRELLRQRHARQSRRAASRRTGSAASIEPKPLYRTLKEQRSLLNSLVALQAKRSGVPHAHVHADLRRRVGGPPVARASVAQLQARIDLLR